MSTLSPQLLAASLMQNVGLDYAGIEVLLVLVYLLRNFFGILNETVLISYYEFVAMNA